MFDGPAHGSGVNLSPCLRSVLDSDRQRRVSKHAMLHEPIEMMRSDRLRSKLARSARPWNPAARRVRPIRRPVFTPAIAVHIRGPHRNAEGHRACARVELQPSERFRECARSSFARCHRLHAGRTAESAAARCPLPSRCARRPRHGARGSGCTWSLRHDATASGCGTCCTGSPAP